MKKFIIFTPFLLAIFPSLYIFNHNKGEFPLNVVWLPMVVVLLIVAVLFFVLRLFIKDPPKVVIIASVAVSALFYYGFIYDLLSGQQVWGILWGRHQFLFPFWLLIFGYGLYYFTTTRRHLRDLAGIFAFSTAVLVLPSIISILIYSVKIPGITTKEDGSYLTDNIETKQLVAGKAGLPDIYYIIPDAYAGYDVLKKYYGFDNKEFYDYLGSKGFAIAKNSRSNYILSYSSLASTLDMRYINFLGDIFGKESLDILPLREIIADNRTLRSLKNTGYNYVHFDSDQTTFLDGNEATDTLESGEMPIDLFMREVLKTTILRPLPGRYGLRENAINDIIRKNVLETFDNLQKSVLTKGPKFVFVHIASPHGPFVFGRNGEKVNSKFSNFTTSEEDMGLYLNQLIFINKKITETVDSILSQSPKPPIIIIQSDHGVLLTESKYPKEEIKYVRFENFGAYYLPSKSKSILPQKMSAVNTFRFIFDNYFGTDYGMLDHKSYWTDDFSKFYSLEEINAFRNLSN